MSEFLQLKTPFEQNYETSWEEYPRPQLKRDSYISLCGEWSLFVSQKNETKDLGKIIVPFPPESRISGINRTLKEKEKYIYIKEFEIEKQFLNDKTIIHFGAVDQVAKIYLNNNYIGKHIGGYLPFEFDITDHISIGKNELKVEVIDTLDNNLPYGKQRKKRGGMWYTPISGIWQPVWLESVPKSHFKSLKLIPTLDSITIEVDGGLDEKTIVINNEFTYKFKGNKTTIKIEKPINWTPENPYLYYFTLSDSVDSISSYFALRTITIEKINEKSYICLNNKPYFFNGLLDQGYYSDGIYTPFSPNGFKFDILTMKSLGFNTLRKHIKIEPNLFYYYCDKYGMIVFQDMVNNGKYNFLLDTALPTVLSKKHYISRSNKRQREIFINDSKQTIELLYNHPCVAYYTIFNEGWGQFNADEVYKLLKPLDKTRVFDSTSGWFKENLSDVDSEHIYFKDIKLKSTENKPLVLSEFGGYSYKIPEHSFNQQKNYGYKTFNSQNDFENDLIGLYENQIKSNIKNGLCSCILTQVSDVEDETNGLLTYDRQVLKINKENIRKINEKLYKEFSNQFDK